MNETATFITIAIDGGAASGKSTTSKALAESLNLMHVDTGSHYRAVTLALLEADVAPEETAVQAAIGKLSIGTDLHGRQAWVSVNGRTPEPAELRSDAVNAQVSLFAAIPAVRNFLFDYQRSQREVARENDYAGLVMEGRDIGSVIFPDAELRIFLEADPETRARRRAEEGQKDAISQRDKIDSSRKTAPLTCPEGAIRIDTGTTTLEAVVEQITGLIHAHGA